MNLEKEQIRKFRRIIKKRHERLTDLLNEAIEKENEVNEQSHMLRTDINDDGHSLIFLENNFVADVNYIRMRVQAAIEVNEKMQECLLKYALKNYGMKEEEK